VKSGVALFAAGAPLAGLAFESGAQKGTTDAKGAFTYEEGKTVRFSLGGELLGEPAGAPLVTPYQIAGSTKCEDTDALKKLVTKLQKATDQDAAFRAFITAFDGEAWKQSGADTFAMSQAALRGQGVATDGASWFFSGTTGLEKTDGGFSTTVKNAVAIPLPLLAQGSDHIGDIDVWGGKIYAPVEDKNYKAPKVVLYDPSSLDSGTVMSVDASLQTKGVPWIAVDGPHDVAYMAEWDPTPELHVFALSNMAYQRAIPLSRTLGRIQGAKVHKGQLYASMDDAQKSIVKIHVASGTVIDLFTIGDTQVEEEGLVVFARPDGSLLHTLDVNAARTGVELRHHAITREPLRWSACP
jgi:hypothetical protein